MTENILVHWTEGPVIDALDYYTVSARLEIDGVMTETYLCHLEEAHLLNVSNHFKTSIDALEIPFGDRPDE